MHGHHRPKTRTRRAWRANRGAPPRGTRLRDPRAQLPDAARRARRDRGGRTLHRLLRGEDKRGGGSVGAAARDRRDRARQAAAATSACWAVAAGATGRRGPARTGPAAVRRGRRDALARRSACVVGARAGCVLRASARLLSFVARDDGPATALVTRFASYPSGS